MALAKRPDLLILDEPVASLDPLARREFLQTLMEDVAAHDLGVMLSSHLVADIERVCDYLIVLVDSRVQVSSDVDELLAPPLGRPTRPGRSTTSVPGGDRCQPHRAANNADRSIRRAGR
jgi:ABC-2 type transport system ATP-binding protein